MVDTLREEDPLSANSLRGKDASNRWSVCISSLKLVRATGISDCLVVKRVLGAVVDPEPFRETRLLEGRPFVPSSSLVPIDLLDLGIEGFVDNGAFSWE